MFPSSDSSGLPMMIVQVSTFMIFTITVYGDMEAPIRHPDFGLNVVGIAFSN